MTWNCEPNESLLLLKPHLVRVFYHHDRVKLTQDSSWEWLRNNVDQLGTLVGSCDCQDSIACVFMAAWHFTPKCGHLSKHRSIISQVMDRCLVELSWILWFKVSHKTAVKASSWPRVSLEGKTMEGRGYKFTWLLANFISWGFQYLLAVGDAYFISCSWASP